MVIKLAIRNLRRNRWRTVLTAGGIAVAVALLVWTVCMIDGMVGQMVDAATGVESAQIQIHEAEYVENPTLYDTFVESDELLETIRTVPLVEGATGRCYAFGLVGNERRSQVARLVGISPADEPEVTSLREGLIEGEWLGVTPMSTIEPLRKNGLELTVAATWGWASRFALSEALLPPRALPRQVILGVTLAEQLEVTIGDELILFTQAVDGALGNESLTVVGIVKTNNSLLDRLAVYAHIVDVQYVGALEGRLHEIAIRVDDHQRAPEVAVAIAAAIGGVNNSGEDDEGDGDGDEALVVRPWQEIMPDFAMMIDIYDKSIGITFFIIYLIVGLGILNTQRMSALERRREFGVLLAIGLSPGKMRRMIVAETIILSFLGTVAGAVLGFAISWYHATYGFDLAAFSDQGSFSMSGISFSGQLFLELSWRSVLLPMAWTLVVALICGFWPAFTSARLNATEAISGRTD